MTNDEQDRAAISLRLDCSSSSSSIVLVLEKNNQTGYDPAVAGMTVPRESLVLDLPAIFEDEED